MNLSVRIPASNGHTFTKGQAATAVGKPLLDRTGDDARQIGTIREAVASPGGDLLLTIEVDNVAVQYDLAEHAVRGVSLVPRPHVREPSG